MLKLRQTSFSIHFLKYMKLKKISIIFLFLSGVVFTFLLCSIAIILLALSSINKIDNILTSNVSSALYKRSGDTLLERIKGKALYYNRIFGDAITYVDILTVQANIIREMITYYSTDNLLSLEASSLSFNPDKRIFFNNSSENPRIFYWGNGPVISEEVVKIRSILFMEPVIKALMNRELNYNGPYFAVFMVEEHFLIDFFCNPDVGAELDPPTKEAFDSYYSAYKDPKGRWTEVYKDLTGYFLVTTCNLLYDKDGKVTGRVGIDLSVDYILNDLEEFHIDTFYSTDNSEIRKKDYYKDESFSFIFDSANGELVAFPGDRIELLGLPKKDLKSMKYRSILDIKLTDSKFDEVRDIYAETQKQSDNWSSIYLNGKEYLFVFSQIPINNWVLCSLVPAQDMVGSISFAKEQMNKSFHVLTLNMLTFGAIYVLICIIILAVVFRRIIIIPITRLESAVKLLMKGEFGLQVKESGAKEISDMICSFNFLSNTLAKYSGDIKDRISKRLYVENEVNIAKQIQSAVLPHSALSVFSNSDADVNAKLISNKIISSVFYDYFPLAKDKIAFLTGEVSGKNVSAAFFMIVAKTLIKDMCLKYPNNPAEVLGEVNRVLCEKHDIDMYLSLGLVFYDEKKSSIYYSFAGFINMLKLSPSGNIEGLSHQRFPVLGLIDEALYCYEERTLIPKSKLFLFTKGVMEALNIKGELYSSDKLEAVIKNCILLSSEECCTMLVEDIKKFKDTNNEDKAVLVFSRKSSEYELHSLS